MLHKPSAREATQTDRQSFVILYHWYMHGIPRIATAEHYAKSVLINSILNVPSLYLLLKGEKIWKPVCRNGAIVWPCVSREYEA